MLDEAQRKGRAYLEQAQTAMLAYTCNYIRTALALVEAKRGAVVDAVALSEASIRAWNADGVTGLNIGLAYESRARIALIMNDEEAFVHYARACATQYRGKQNSALTDKYNKLLQEARKLGMDISALDVDGADTRDAQEQLREIRRKLRKCTNADERAKEALNILHHCCGTKQGYLFGLREAGLTTLSSNCEQTDPGQLIKQAQTYLEAELEDTNEATITAADERASEGQRASFVSEDGVTFDPIPLYATEQNRLVITGLALLSKAEGNAVFDRQLVHTISETLLQKGDVISRTVAL
jgi:hypothetical protein